VGALFLLLGFISASFEQESTGTALFLVVAFLFLLPALFAGPAHSLISDRELRKKARTAFALARLLGTIATGGLAWLAVGPMLNAPTPESPSSYAVAFSILFAAAWVVRFFGAYYSAQSESGAA